MAEALGYNSTGGKRQKRDLLSRSKRRWVLSTIELVEEDVGPFPKETTQPVDRTLSFDVAIADINDKVPTFDHPVMKASVKESTPEGLLPVRLQARDMDEVNTINSTFTIKILSQEPKEPQLKVDQLVGTTMGQLSFEGCFNYDKVNKYKVIVEVKDHGKPPLSSTAVVNLNILDSNSHMPKFKQRKYEGEIQEMEINKEILRIGVEDKDTPKTPGWKAKYFFIKGNEDNNYKITTDPIGVENDEPLYICASKKGGSTAAPPAPDTINITLTVIDVNDPPRFDKNVTEWVTIDPKTGIIKSAVRMDRESPFVDDRNTYTIVIAAIDDGTRTMVMCTDKADKVTVSAADLDKAPFSGPFSFSLGEGDGTLKKSWKIEPASGQEAGLVALTSLPYGNYSVPLVVQDQQGMVGEDTVVLVTICDCGGGDACRGKLPLKCACVHGSGGSVSRHGLLALSSLAGVFLRSVRPHAVAPCVCCPAPVLQSALLTLLRGCAGK
ncbi:hypothetical protein CRUP_000482, partial [Coryphaenoides rupestris]